jgi:cytochrome c553
MWGWSYRSLLSLMVTATSPPPSATVLARTAMAACTRAAAGGVFVPRVAGLQYEYLLRQLHDTVDGRRPNMRAQHLRLLESADMEDLEGFADYMSRLVGR